MRSIIHIPVALTLATLFATSGLAANPGKTAKLRAILGREQKTMVLSHLRANPEPRSEITYNEYVARKQSEKTVATAELKL